jgi:low affinity Fe/Cu permease
MSSISKGSFFERLSSLITRVTGSVGALVCALLIIGLWLVTGPIFNYSQKWQLTINTITSIITFLMVFIIQKAQNKDALAIQLKLNELIAAHDVASNMLVNAEDMSEEELKVMQKYYSRLAEHNKRLAERNKKEGGPNQKRQEPISMDDINVIASKKGKSK